MSDSLHVHGVHEIVLESSRDYPRPASDCRLTATATSPSGRTLRVRGFRDGGRAWRVRISPDSPGKWSWSTRCSDSDNPGLHAQSGVFHCEPYHGDNPVFRHGPLVVDPSHRHFQHADGTPFFWLGDTAWNGVIRGDDDNWNRYLATRAAQNFSVIQFVANQWRGEALDEEGEPACLSTDPLEINPRFFQRLDHRIAMINNAGFIAVPVLLWSLLDSDIGNILSEDDAITLASYIVARYDAHQVAWLLGGDCDYPARGVERWKHIGREVFSCGHNRLVSLHPCGVNWPGEEFRREDWYDFIGYQSGHGDIDSHLAWLATGPPAQNWNAEPPLPVINLEPNYETAYGYYGDTQHSEYDVRRAAYWSLLVSPPAGLTYGHDAVWNWNLTAGPSEGHGDWHHGRVPPWHTGLDTPGIRHMTVLRSIFEKLDWTTLTPAQHLLADQPGDASIASFVAAARAADGQVVAYAPAGKEVTFSASLPVPVRIVDPRTGTTAHINEEPRARIPLPDTRDWLVIAGGERNAPQTME